jgi:hypothetical protein
MPCQETTIVVIDQTPLRRAIGADCTAAMGRLERARVGWHKFERHDKPAFVRWRAREFGALLSKAREVEEQIRDAQTLVHEVEMEMRRGFQDAHSAYQFRRENLTAEKEESTEARELGTGAKLSEFEQEARSFAEFWVQFKAAVVKGDKAAIAGMTRFPFAYEKLTKADFVKQCDEIFSAKVRRCFRNAKPIKANNRDSYSVFYGETIFVFEIGKDGYQFADLGVND